MCAKQRVLDLVSEPEQMGKSDLDKG